MDNDAGGIGRLPETEKASGYKRSSLYRLEKLGLFPSRVKLGKRAVGWRRDEVRAWIESRQLAGSSQAE